MNESMSTPLGTHGLEDGHRFLVEPWRVREIGLDYASLGLSESLFTLSNGHIGVRGNLGEGDPASMPGTYLASFHEARPLPYAEAGYGYPESGQTGGSGARATSCCRLLGLVGAGKINPADKQAWPCAGRKPDSPP